MEMASREEKDAAIEMDLVQPGQIQRGASQDQAQPGVRYGDAQSPANCGEQKTFRQHLLQQLSNART